MKISKSKESNSHIEPENTWHQHSTHLSPSSEEDQVRAMTRRNFMKTAVATLATAGIPSLASASFSAPDVESDNCFPTPCGLSVIFEWGALKEVVVGCPWVRIPTDLYKFYSNYMPESSIALAKQMSEQYGGQLLSEAIPIIYDTAVYQMNKAIEILQEYGVIVHQVLPFHESEEAFIADLAMYGGFQQFARDPIIVIGNRMIETAMYAPIRRKERFALRRTIGDRLMQLRANCFSIPEPLPYAEGENGFPPGAYLEGGDVFVIGKDIYVGLSGNASSPTGIQCLQAILGPEYQVHPVPLSPKFLHLDCILATPRPGLAIICREGFIYGLPPFLRGWQLIEVSAAEAEEKLATNVLVINEQTTLVAEETPSVADALIKAGQTVRTTPFSAVFQFGGAFRCWHHPLIRIGGTPPPIF